MSETTEEKLAPEAKTLIETMVRIALESDPTRLYPYPGIVVDHKSKAGNVLAFDIHPISVYKWFWSELLKDRNAEVAFALDRHAKPGQQTKHDSIVTMICWVKGVIHIGMIDYNVEPFVIEDTDWSHPVWLNLVAKELKSTAPDKFPYMINVD